MVGFVRKELRMGERRLLGWKGAGWVEGWERRLPHAWKKVVGVGAVTNIFGKELSRIIWAACQNPDVWFFICVPESVSWGDAW